MDYRRVKYLDPKNDLTFRKIFGQHTKIMKSFLNAILPLEEGQQIEHLVYQDPAMLPEIPELKHSIVDVKCTDNHGRQFLVEMQMYWSDAFKSRMLFNAGKAFVKQLGRGESYNRLLPVYGLSLVNDIYLPEPEYKDQYYHHYKMVHNEISQEVIEGIELIFIELPKFKASSMTEKRLANLWLRFLTEIHEDTKEVDSDMYAEEAINDALEHLQVSAFSPDELDYYDDYWDKVRLERIAIDDAEEKMMLAQKKLQVAEEGMQAAKAEIKTAKEEIKTAKAEVKTAKAEVKTAKEGEQAAKEEAEAAKKEAEAANKRAASILEQAQEMQRQLASTLKQQNAPWQQISELTGLSKSEIESL